MYSRQDTFKNYQWFFFERQGFGIRSDGTTDSGFRLIPLYTDSMIVTRFPRSVSYKQTVSMNIDNQINNRKAYLKEKIRKNTTIVLNNYAIAKEICDCKRNIEQQDKCRETCAKIESMMLVLSEMEKELKLLEQE
jgi:hypothetical protein